MEERFLIDTSVVIKYLNGSLPQSGFQLLDKILDAESIISFITEIELQVWTPPNEADLEIYRQFIASSRILGINETIISETIVIRKSNRLKLPDAVIAATSKVYNLTLIADNDKDFLRVPSLSYVNPAGLTI